MVGPKMISNQVAKRLHNMRNMNFMTAGAGFKDTKR